MLCFFVTSVMVAGPAIQTTQKLLTLLLECSGVSQQVFVIFAWLSLSVAYIDFLNGQDRRQGILFGNKFVLHNFSDPCRALSRPLQSHSLCFCALSSPPCFSESFDVEPRLWPLTFRNGTLFYREQFFVASGWFFRFSHWRHHHLENST